MSTHESKVVVSRVIDAAPDAVFEVLTDPHKHVQLDGSGFVLGLDHGDRIERTGQNFRMNMAGDHMGGEYQTDNHVVGYDKNHLVAWKTAPAGTEPPGWEWVWELDGQDADRTEVTLTYDWSAVTDQALLEKVSFPLVTEEQLEASLGNLAAAVTG